MGRSLACLLPVLIAAAFVAGRMTGTDSASASAAARVYTGGRVTCSASRPRRRAARSQRKEPSPDSLAAASVEAGTRRSSASPSGGASSATGMIACSSMVSASSFTWSSRAHKAGVPRRPANLAGCRRR